MKLFVNELVKGIEFFLPFAPIVMEEYANEWFNMSQWGGGGDDGGGEAGGEARGGAGGWGGCNGQGVRESQQPVHQPNLLREGWEGKYNPRGHSRGQIVPSSDGIHDRQTILSFPNINLPCT